MAQLTPGRITALWHILRTIGKLGGVADEEELMAFARRSALRSGGLPLVEGLRLARVGHFVENAPGTDAAERALVVAALGLQALALEEADEPGPEARRLLLSVLLLRDPPAWVAYWQGDPSSADVVIPQPQRTLLGHAGLFPLTTPEDDLATWAFWDALDVVPLEQRTGDNRKAIGDAGEELTVEYEQRRLRDEGFPRLANDVQWLARESDAYGFDVLSFCGSRYSQGQNPDAPLAIEVKSTTLPASVTFRFFLTAHEWRTASKLGENYRLYLWANVDLGPPPASTDHDPVALRAATLRSHIPGGPDCGEDCDWQTTQLVLPLTGSS
jgi:hypothetical protein